MNKNIILFSISLLVSSQAIGMWTPVPVPTADALAAPREGTEPVSKKSKSALTLRIDQFDQEIDDARNRGFYPEDSLERARTLKSEIDSLEMESREPENLKMCRTLHKQPFIQAKAKANRVFNLLVEERALSLREIDMNAIDAETREAAITIVTQLQEDFYSSIVNDENLTGEQREEILTAIMEAYVNVTQN